ncbi:MAG: hypothetical protein JSS43_02390 [Proteobacteria bacterium]|nr:hypothetical protein [Pseudomonadota bacterium]
MSEIQSQSGAAPALAAHSKDASAPGQTAASEATGEPHGQAAGSAGGTSGASVSEAVKETRNYVYEQGSKVASQGTTYVREQPLLALAVTGGVCFLFGYLLGRR